MWLLKSILFYPLLFLRGLIIAIGGLLSGFCILVTLVLSIFKWTDNLPDMPWLEVLIPAGAGFVIFILLEFYDQILLKLNPTDSELTLYK